MCYKKEEKKFKLKKKLFSSMKVLGVSTLRKIKSFLFTAQAHAFGKAGLEEINDHSLTTMHFEKWFLKWKF